MLYFLFNFHWSLLLVVQLTINQSWFHFAQNRWQAIIWTKADPVQWGINVALREGEFILSHSAKICVYIIKKSHEHNRNKNIFQETILNPNNNGSYTSHLSNGDTCRYHANHVWYALSSRIKFYHISMICLIKQNKILPYLYDIS